MKWTIYLKQQQQRIPSLLFIDSSIWFKMISRRKWLAGFLYLSWLYLFF